jgi:hypothetical protein
MPMAAEALITYGGSSYQMALNQGVDKTEIDQMLVENPRRLASIN